MKQLQSLQTLLLVLLLLPALPLHAQTQPRVEGTLFTSAEERNYLDYLRQDFLLRNQQQGFDIDESQIPDIPTDGTAAGPAGPTEYTLDGILRRGDGRISIWLNNQLVAEDALPANARLISDGATYALQFTTPTGTQLLRPGQTLLIATGAVQERYQRPPPASTAPASPAAVADSDATDTGEAESVVAADAASVGATTEQTPIEVATATDSVAGDESPPDTVINSLPTSVRDDPDALDSLIETLQTMRDRIGNVDEDE